MSELKEYDIAESLLPTAYNKNNKELIFTVPCTLLSGIKFKVILFQIMENQQQTTNQYILLSMS
jgi:hypothetical protein